MSVAELLPTLQTLSRADKLKVMQFLVQELAAEEEALSLQPGVTYPVWSPYNSHDAAQKLAALLEEDKQANNA
jgi:hypothetical protein